tara:strand:+ start:643 stop:1251 length:609 start_codon:yes stop_codon:yes gene_type:complete
MPNDKKWTKCSKILKSKNNSKWNTSKGFENFYKNKKRRNRKTYQDGKNLVVKVNDKIYTYPPKAGVLIFDKTYTKVLAVKNNYNPDNPKWGLPKGHMEDDENFIECAQRELNEETGLNITINSDDPYIKINNSVYYVFFILNKVNNITPIDTNEINESRFVEINELLSFNSNREMYIALTKKLKFAKKICRGIVVNNSNPCE